jgi:serine/threonine protein kinase
LRGRGIGIEIDHLTDIWACGILLHQMICGRHLLLPNQLIGTAILERPMPSMAETAPPGVPRELIQVVDRCLRKVKDQRWQSAAELLTALEPFLPVSAGSSSRSTRGRTAIWRRSKRSGRRAGCAARARGDADDRGVRAIVD